MYLNINTLNNYSSKKLFAKYAIPNLIGMILGSTTMFIDGFFVAHYISSDAFAAINIVYPVTALSFGFYVMLTVGSLAIAGEYIGKGNILRANLIFTQTILIVSTLMSIPLVVIFIFKENILPILGAHNSVYDYALYYIDPILVATYFWGISYVLSQFIRLNGFPKYASFILIMASLINIFLDYLFITVLEFGISGAAWATALAQIISFLFGVLFLFRRDLKLRIIKIYGAWNYVFKASLNGMSEFWSNISSGIIPWIFNITVYRLAGNDGIIVYSVANYTIMFFILIAYSIGEALTPLVSVSYGCRNKEKIKDFLSISLKVVTYFSIFLSIILLIRPDLLINLLLKDISINTFNSAKLFLRASLPVLICVGINILMSAYYTSIQRAGASAVVSILRSLALPIILIFILPNLFGYIGFMLVLPISEIITLIVALYLYRDRKADIIIV